MKRLIGLVFLIFLIGVLTPEGSASEKEWKMLDKKSSELFKDGRYEEAVKVNHEALKLVRAEFGDQHIEVAYFFNKLGLCYRFLDRFEEAEPLYLKALEIRRQLLAAEAPDVAESVNNLGTLYYLQERYEESEPLYRESLKTHEAVLGSEHLYVAQVSSNLASVCVKLGKYKEAESLYNKSLAIVKKRDPRVIDFLLNKMIELYKLTGEEEKIKELEIKLEARAKVRKIKDRQIEDEKEEKKGMIEEIKNILTSDNE